MLYSFYDWFLGYLTTMFSTVESIVKWFGDWLWVECMGCWEGYGRGLFSDIFLNMIDDKEGNEIFQWADDAGGFRSVELACKNITLSLH